MPKLLRPLYPGEIRTSDEMYEHYLIEKELAERLRHSSKEERTTLYSEVYNDLFRRLPRHPQLTDVTRPEKLARVTGGKIRLVSRFIGPDSVFLEIGAGDCRFPIELASHVRQVYALDVSAEVTRGLNPPANFELILSHGTDVPLPSESVNFAFSYQVMEHIHPDDAAEQLRNIYRVLAPGGMYMCVTPNRLNGPHDISRFFEREPKGFHLKEYTVAELSEMFRQAGFSRVFTYPGGRGRYLKVSSSLVSVVESLIAPLPWKARTVIGELPVIRELLLAPVVGVK